MIEILKNFRVRSYVAKTFVQERKILIVQYILPLLAHYYLSVYKPILRLL